MFLVAKLLFNLKLLFVLCLSVRKTPSDFQQDTRLKLLVNIVSFISFFVDNKINEISSCADNSIYNLLWPSVSYHTKYKYLKKWDRFLFFFSPVKIFLILTNDLLISFDLFCALLQMDVVILVSFIYNALILTLV